MIQDTLNAARDTVVATSSSGGFTGLITVIVSAIVSAVLAYFGGKHGAQKGTGQI